MHVASCATAVTVHTWPEGQLLHTYKSSGEGIMRSLSWNKDGSWLALVPNKGHAEVISVKTNLKHLHFIQDIQHPTCAVFENGTKRNIALGTAMGVVLIYDMKTKSVKKRFPRALSTIFKVEYCNDDSYLIAACENGEIVLYNNTTNSASTSYKIPSTKTVSNIRFHQKKKNIFAGGSKEGVLAVWDIYNSKLKYSNQAHSAPITDITFSPLRSDLIITTGLDRKFMFFEMNSNNCVMQKVLDRSPTAIDFCPDGQAFVVALQNGSIQTYDIRQMDNPVHTFVAHNNQIKQLRFQKKALNESNSYSFSEDKIEIRQTEIDKSNISYNSFGYICEGDVSTKDTPALPSEVKTNETADSFMNALALNLNFSPSIKCDNSASIRVDNSEQSKQILDSKINISQATTHSHHILINSSKTDQDSNLQTNNVFLKDGYPYLKNMLDNIKTQNCSTPKFFSELPQAATFSPIIGNKENKSALSQADFQIIRNVIKEEIKEEVEALKEQVKFKMMDNMTQVRQHFLDLHMYLVKEFIKLEDYLNNVKQSNAVDENNREDILIQENIKLRQEVQDLRNQLSNKNV